MTAPIRHIPRDAPRATRTLPLRDLAPGGVWEHTTGPLVDADRMVIHIAHSVVAWWSATPDGPAIDPALRVRARGTLPEQRWVVRMYVTDMLRLLTPSIGHVVYLRVVCAGVAHVSIPFTIT